MAFSAAVKMVVAWVAWAVVRVSRRSQEVHLTGDDGGHIRRIALPEPPPPRLAFSGRGPCANRATAVNVAIDASLVMDFFMCFPRSGWFPRLCACIPTVHGECRKLALGSLTKHKRRHRKCADAVAACRDPFDAMAANCLAAK